MRGANTLISGGALHIIAHCVLPFPTLGGFLFPTKLLEECNKLQWKLQKVECRVQCRCSVAALADSRPPPHSFTHLLLILNIPITICHHCYACTQLCIWAKQKVDVGVLRRVSSSFTFFHFHPFSSTFICFIHFHSFSFIFIHFHPL